MLGDSVQVIKLDASGQYTHFAALTEAGEVTEGGLGWELTRAGVAMGRGHLDEPGALSLPHLCSSAAWA